MINALAPLLLEGVIDEIGARLKSGKEADLWLVRVGGETIAAKVYKTRHMRSFRNNAGYKEGRRVRNTRTQRAMDRGSRFGQAASEDAWGAKEANALHTLHAAGVHVPRPVMFHEGVLLMELVVDAHGHPAPRLIDADIGREQAAALYADLRGQVIRMLACDLIHGDLSPYNVLLGRNGPVLIDLPQVVDAAHNSQAESFFRRDLENLRRFLAEIDPALHLAANDASEIWRAHVKRELTPDFVPVMRASATLPAKANLPGKRHHPRPSEWGPQGPEHGQRKRAEHGSSREAQPPGRAAPRGRSSTIVPEQHRDDSIVHRGRDRHRGAPAPEVIRVVRPLLKPEGTAPGVTPGAPPGKPPAAGAGHSGDPGAHKQHRRRRRHRRGKPGL